MKHDLCEKQGCQESLVPLREGSVVADSIAEFDPVRTMLRVDWVERVWLWKNLKV